MAELNAYFRSVIEQDRAAVVICDLQHTIIYMNPAAKSYYANRGGAELLGRCVKDCHNPASCDAIDRVVHWFGESAENNLVYISHNAKQNKDVYMVAMRDEDGSLIGYYEKHEYRALETMPMYDME